MSEILLSGLQGSHPLGALAAFGLLRCCQEMDGFVGAKLGWRKGADWFAVLHTEQSMNAKELIQALSNRQKERPSSPEVNWTDNIKTTSEVFVRATNEAQLELAEGKRGFADFLTSFTCEIQDNDGDKMKPTLFYMTSGQQEFLKEVRNLSKSLASGIRVGRLKKTTEDMFREAICGPWKYEDNQHSLGWDPSTERLHALRAKSPTKEQSTGVTAAIWLAFEAMPLFPCFLSQKRLATVGFHRFENRQICFTWPIWSTPVSLATARSLLSLPELAEEEPGGNLRARGVDVVFRSQRYGYKTRGSYYIFRNAYPCQFRASR